MGVNPFDQPNVQESKDNTKQLLDEFRASGTMGGGGKGRVSVQDGEAISSLLAQVKPGDYVALTQYFGETIDREASIAKIRETIARERNVATTSGCGVVAAGATPSSASTPSTRKAATRRQRRRAMRRG